MIIDSEKTEELSQRLSEKRVVFADGTFDLFHLGHVESFKNLHNFGDVVVVGVMSDEWVKAIKGEKRPVFSEKERVELVDSIRYVDYTILLKNSVTGERMPTSVFIKKLRPTVFVSIDPVWEARREEFKDFGVELNIIPRTHESSTTSLLTRIRQAFE